MSRARRHSEITNELNQYNRMSNLNKSVPTAGIEPANVHRHQSFSVGCGSAAALASVLVCCDVIAAPSACTWESSFS